MTLRLPGLLPLALLACAPAGEGGDPVVDADGDGILDVHEGEADPDGDGLPAWRDVDSDGDGLPDAVERGDDDLDTPPFDSDGDRTPDFLDLDSDDNGIPDVEERPLGATRPDTDGDGILDPHDLDDDGDGVPDTLEAARRGLDSDGDGDPDHLDPDSDNDGIPDAVEGHPLRGETLPDDDGDGIPDLRDRDSDGDRVDDRDEAGADPARPRDTDEDGRPDYRDRDSDNDGLDDGEDARVADRLAPDADGDGVRDGAEVQIGTDPSDPDSLPPAPVYEVRARADQELARTLTVEVGRRRVDVMALMFHSTIAATGRFYREVVDRVRPLLLEAEPDLAMGAAMAGNSSQMGADVLRSAGSAQGPVFELLTVPTMAAEPPFPWSDWDWTGSAGPVGLSLVLGGHGFDRSCDGVFDPQDDARPWLPSPSDPFAGTAGGLVDQLPHDAVQGRLPGVGFRPFSMPIIITSSVGDALYPPPPLGPCDEAASLPRGLDEEKVASDFRARGARLILLQGGHKPLQNASEPVRSRVAEFLERFDSYEDLDGDGIRDEPLFLGVNFDLDGDGVITKRERAAILDDPDAAAAEVAEQLLRIVRHVIAARDFSRVAFTVAGDDVGLVSGVEPTSAPVPAVEAAEIGVTLTLRGVVPPDATDQVFRLELVAAGDGTVALGGQPFYVVVPGRGLD